MTLVAGGVGDGCPITNHRDENMQEADMYVSFFGPGEYMRLVWTIVIMRSAHHDTKNPRSWLINESILAMHHSKAKLNSCRRISEEGLSACV